VLFHALLNTAPKGKAIWITVAGVRSGGCPDEKAATKEMPAAQRLKSTYNVAGRQRFKSAIFAKIPSRLKLARPASRYAYPQVRR
jgi:hypothetical protein